MNQNFFKGAIDWYINSSFHVAAAAVALVGVTNYYAKLEYNYSLLIFVFCATMSSYNITKYYEYVRTHIHFKKTLQSIIIFTIIGLIASIYYYFTFNYRTQITIFLFAILNSLYVIPFGKSKLNLRNRAGIKIYIVSICWSAITLLLPILEANAPLQPYVIFAFIQRFILTLILILIFEIIDLGSDDSQLKTLPQVIGTNNTKAFIYLLVVAFFVLDFYKRTQFHYQIIINLIVIASIIAFTYFADKNKTKYYTLLWAEGIPLLWFTLMLIIFICKLN